MANSSIRIDKWLWYARFVKSRTLAAKLVTGGNVRVNGARVKAASNAIKLGDVLTISLPAGVRVVRVCAAGTRRGPAPEAQLLCEMIEQIDRPRARGARTSQASERLPGTGRPTKRERRELDRLMGRE